MTDEEVNAFTYEIEKLHHGTPSGIDNTVVTYARPVYFVKGQPIETFKAGQTFYRCDRRYWHLRTDQGICE